MSVPCLPKREAEAIEWARASEMETPSLWRLEGEEARESERDRERGEIL